MAVLFLSDTTPASNFDELLTSAIFAFHYYSLASPQ